MRTRYATMTLALASLFPLARSFAADTKMVKAVSDHFELYTTDSAAAKAALTHFETVRAYVLRAFHAKDPFAAPVRLVGFKSAGEYEPYLPKNRDLASKAFLEAGEERVTIVMSTLKKEDYQYGVREYVTAFLNKIAPTMPYWLRTGLAELYCTVREENGQIKLGSEPARDFHTTIPTDVDMALVFSLNGGISRNKGALDFYADSSQNGDAMTQKGAAMANLGATSTVDYPAVLWQLTHMLMFKKEYSPKFGAFVGAVCDESTNAALQQVYGQSLDGLKQDLLLYIKMPSHAVVSTSFQLDKPVTPQVSQLSAADSATVLADLKAAR